MMLVALPDKRRPGCPVIGCRNKPLWWHRGWRKLRAKLCQQHYVEAATTQLWVLVE